MTNLKEESHHSTDNISFFPLLGSGADRHGQLGVFRNLSAAIRR